MKKLWLFFFSLVLLCPQAWPQEISGSYSISRNEAQVQHLLELLTKGRLIDAMGCFMGADYLSDQELPDLLVFINKTKRIDAIKASNECLMDDGSVKIELAKRGKKRTDLFGEKFVYLVVFVAEENIGPGTEETLTTKLTPSSLKPEGADSSKPGDIEGKPAPTQETTPYFIYQSSLDYALGTSEFFLVSLIKTVLGALPGGTSIDTSAKSDSEKLDEKKGEPFSVFSIVGTTGDKTLSYGFKRLPLIENTVNRFTVVEKGPNNKEYSHLATFGNYCSSIIGSSIGFAGTFFSPEQREELSDKRIPVNAFLFGHLYLKRPRLPMPHSHDDAFLERIAKRCSLSLTFGTALKMDLLDDLFVGVSLGHISGSLGLVAGYNFRTNVITIGDKTESKRRAHLCVGVNFAL